MTDETKPEPEAASEAEAPVTKATKAKRGKATAEAGAKMEACATLAELATIWMGLKPEEQERDRGAYYGAKRRIAAAWRP